MASESMEDVENNLYPDNFVSRVYCITNFRYFTYFAVICITGLVFSHSFVENSVSGPLIDYIPSAWNSSLLKAATVICINEGLSSIFIFVFTVVSNDYLGPLKTIVFSTFLYLMGLIMLGVSVRKFSLESSYALFVVGGLLVSIGKAVKTPVLKNFLADQFYQEHNKDKRDQVSKTNAWWRVSNSFCVPCLSDRWWYCTCALGVICSIIYQYCISTSGKHVSLHIIVSSTVILVTGSLFCCGSSSYICSRPARNSSSLVGKVTQREDVKNMLKMFPMFGVFVPYTFVKMASITFFFLQIENFKPARYTFSTSSILLIVSDLSNFLVSYIIRSFISKMKLNATQEKDVALIKIGIGLIFSLLCCIIAYLVEHSRLHFVLALGKTEISANWMIPQFICVGLMKALAEGGLDDLQLNYIPQSWDGRGLNLNKLALGLMKFLNIPFIFAFNRWIKDNVNTSRLDHYYSILVMISVANCIISFYICTSYRDTAVPGEQIETNVIVSAISEKELKVDCENYVLAIEDGSESCQTREFGKSALVKYSPFKLISHLYFQLLY